MIVPDTNIFISGIFWPGPPHDIIVLAEKGRIELATSAEMLEELFGVLRREKFDNLFVQAETSRDEVFKKISALVILYPSGRESSQDLTDFPHAPIPKTGWYGASPDSEAKLYYPASLFAWRLLGK